MLKISKICLNLKTERNRFCNQSIPLFFESEQETHNLLKNTTFFHPFFPLSFCNKAVRAQDGTAFYGPSTHSALHMLAFTMVFCEIAHGAVRFI